MVDFGRSMLWFWVCYIIVTCVGILHTVFNIYVLKMKPMDKNGMGEGYEKTKPWHPLYNILLFSFFGWLYMNGLTEPTFGEALLTGAVWSGICIVFDLFGWVLVKHPWSLSFKEFYIDYQPWITLSAVDNADLSCDLRRSDRGLSVGLLIIKMMKPIQIAALALIAVFYTAYFAKMFLQRRKGVQTDQIGKGEKSRKTLVIEILMKTATYSIVAAEVASILINLCTWNSPLTWIGIGVAALGVLVFITAMRTMKNNWRAGIPAKDKTELVTNGIYRISRNPAFLGFDLMYLGLLISFFNLVHLAFALYAIVMLHLQILSEERYLIDTFGEQYTAYQKRTGRYFIL